MTLWTFLSFCFLFPFRTELAIDASQLYLGANPNHDHVLNEIRISGASLVRVWANWSSTVARHPNIQGNAALVRADIDARNMSITAEGYVRGNPLLETLNFELAGFRGPGSMGRSVSNPALETNIARVFCAEMLSDYGWDHVPDRTWHPSCACSDTANANYDGSGFQIMCASLSGSISTILTRLELDMRGHIHVQGAAFSCLRLKLADIVC